MNNTIQKAGSLIVSLVRPENTPRVLTQITLTILRVVAGVVIFHNGFNKLDDIQGFAEAYVAAIGLPFPIFFSYVAAITELIGSPLLVVGLLTRPAAFGLMSTMLIAIYHHIHTAGFNIPSIELAALYCASFAFFAVNGASQFSLDQAIANRFFPKSTVNPETIEALKNSYQQEYVKP